MIHVYYYFEMDGQTKEIDWLRESYEEETDYRKAMAKSLRNAREHGWHCEKSGTGSYEIVAKGEKTVTVTISTERSTSYGELAALQEEFDKQTAGHEWSDEEYKDQCFMDFCDQYTHMNDDPQVYYA